MKMGKWKYRGILNRILQENMKKHSMKLRLKWKKVMKESVEKHKISDVEVASYLSSGVDSSYLTYLGQVDHTFTVGFDEGEYSEIQDAKDFAESIHMKNDAKVITPDEYWDSLSDIQYYMDEPVADPAAVALYF